MHGMRSRGVQNAAERGGRRRKIWKASRDVWKPCNPLKFHKTAKDFFGKAWSKTRDFWRSLEKAWRSAIVPPLLPAPTASISNRDSASLFSHLHVDCADFRYAGIIRPPARSPPPPHDETDAT